MQISFFDILIQLAIAKLRLHIIYSIIQVSNLPPSGGGRAGVKNPINALIAHVDEEDKLTRQIVVSGQRRNVWIINESGLYFLIPSSKLPKAREVLGYSRTADAIRPHVDDEDKGVFKMPTPGGLQTTTFINESGLYSLILSSKLPKAREVLEVLRGRNVLVFLERDAMEEWSGKLAQLLTFCFGLCGFCLHIDCK